MIKIHSTLRKSNLKNKRVFVRADLNTNQTIKAFSKNDFRLKNIVPTLNLILKKGGTIILCSHYGRPMNQEPELSTQHLIPWFKEQGFTIGFAATPEDIQVLSEQEKYSIIMLENIRFFAGEEACDLSFAKRLAACADYYVNDAFGSCHRKSASLTVLPTLFTKENRSIGLLVENELRHLNPLLTHQKHPFVVMIGGIKGATKIPLLHDLLPKLDTLLITTPLCFTFFAAMGKKTGKSYTENNMLSAAKKLLIEAKKQNVTIFFPDDFQVTEASFETPKKIHLASQLGPKDVGISIGPDTTDRWKQKLLEAKTIFINGLPGNPQYVETLESTRILLHALQRISGTTVIGGGDSISLVNQLGCDDVGYLSTGGGATLAYLSGQVLFALTFFED